MGVTTILLPLGLPSGVVLLRWQALNEQYGALNSLLHASGRESLRWLGSPLAFLPPLGRHRPGNVVKKQRRGMAARITRALCGPVK